MLLLLRLEHPLLLFEVPLKLLLLPPFQILHLRYLLLVHIHQLLVDRRRRHWHCSRWRWLSLPGWGLLLNLLWWRLLMGLGLR